MARHPGRREQAKKGTPPPPKGAVPPPLPPQPRPSSNPSTASLPVPGIGVPFQDILDAAAPGSVVCVPPDKGEVVGLTCIEQPITLDGQGATFCAKAGPVLQIAADRVSLRNLKVEVTGDAPPPAGAGDAAACAIWVEDGLTCHVMNVEVRGIVHGIQGEEGRWWYPLTLPLGRLAPRKEHVFKFQVCVPAVAQIVSGISGVAVEPTRLEPGLNEVTLRLDPPLPDVLFSGCLHIRTLLTRAIRLTGMVAVGSADPASVLHGQGEMLWSVPAEALPRAAPKRAPAPAPPPEPPQPIEIELPPPSDKPETAVDMAPSAVPSPPPIRLPSISMPISVPMPSESIFSEPTTLARGPAPVSEAQGPPAASTGRSAGTFSLRPKERQRAFPLPTQTGRSAGTLSVPLWLDEAAKPQATPASGASEPPAPAATAPPAPQPAVAKPAPPPEERRAAQPPSSAPGPKPPSKPVRPPADAYKAFLGEQPVPPATATGQGKDVEDEQQAAQEGAPEAPGGPKAPKKRTLVKPGEGFGAFGK